ncbi:MAG: M14 family zinc carboxypeptidase, partial [Vicinamibacteraceae bacterium]
MLSRRCRLALVVWPLLTGCEASPAAQSAPDPQMLARAWDAEHLPLPPAPLVRHADVLDLIEKLKSTDGSLFQVEQIGKSVEGRSLNHIWFGRGPMHVLLWSQMHGDEPTATSALFDVCTYIARHRSEPQVSQMLERLTVHMVPMVNPDGAERWTRRNAQGLDVNRDAVLLQSPEARALKTLRNRLEPAVGFNLHNQNWGTSVGTPPQPAAISVLAVASDEAVSDTPQRVLAKKTAAVVRQAIEPFARGRMGRYDETFNVRAFGDNFSRAGTGVVLIETGPWPGAEPDRALVRINFVAIVSALDALASGSVERADPELYTTLPENDSNLFHTIVKGGTIWPGTGVAPFKGDVGLRGTRVVRQTKRGREIRWASSIEELGDMRVYGALETIDAEGLVVAPRISDAEVGQVISLPEASRVKRSNGDSSDQSERGSKSRPFIGVGQPAELLLLEPQSAPGRYRVRQVVEVGS